MPTRDNIVRLKHPILETALNLHEFSFGGCSGSLLARNLMILSFSTVSRGSTQITIVQLSPADSGHGGQIKDTDGDEFDGYDEGGNITKC
jgi:hypothetical protein